MIIYSLVYQRSQPDGRLDPLTVRELLSQYWQRYVHIRRAAALIPFRDLNIVNAVRAHRRQAKGQQGNTHVRVSRMAHGMLFDTVLDPASPDWRGVALRGIRRALREHRAGLKRLDGRSEYTRRSDLEHRLVGGVATEAGSILKLLAEKRAREVYRSKKPTNLLPHVGIEIECLAPCDRPTLAAALLPFSSYVSIVDDGSIRTDAANRYAHEVRICVEEAKAGTVITQICNAMRGVGATVNRSCGLHVHIDCRNRSPQDTFNRLKSIQSLMFSMVPSSRRQNQYCRAVRGAFSYRRDRYSSINCQAYREHQTIEVRLHSGTVDPTKILNWLALLIATVSVPAPAKPIGTVAALIRHVPVLAPLADYFRARQRAFKKSVDAATQEQAAA